MDIANKALCPDIVLKHKKEKKPAFLIEVSVPNDFGLNVTNEENDQIPGSEKK